MSGLNRHICKNCQILGKFSDLEKFNLIEKFVTFILKYLFRSSSRSRSFSRSVSPRTPQPRSPVRAAKPVPNPRRMDTRRERDKERPSDRSRERERTRFGHIDVDFAQFKSTMFQESKIGSKQVHIGVVLKLLQVGRFTNYSVLVF